MSKYIRRIVVALLSLVCFVACKEREGGEISETRKLLNDVQTYMMERPDSAFTVLSNHIVPSSEEERTKSVYAILAAKAEYLATGEIKSDSLLQKAVLFYGDTKSLESALAYYQLGCYHWGRDYDKAIEAFRSCIENSPAKDKETKGQAYHAIGSCHYAEGRVAEGVRSYRKALELLDENESEQIKQLCRDIRNNLAIYDMTDWADGADDNASKRTNVLLVILSIFLASSLCVVIFFVRKSKPYSSNQMTTSPLERKLKEGKAAFEGTLAYRTLMEIKGLNERELATRVDIDAEDIEEAVFISFNDAYQFIIQSGDKINRQDILLCLYVYLKLSNNVIAFIMKSVPGTIRQRKLRLQGKLPENVSLTLFSSDV